MSARHTRRAVVIDDSPEMREVVGLALTKGGYTVVAEASDGLSGIRTVREVEPDVVVLDIDMPVLDGLSALPHLRDAVPDARIVVLSSCSGGSAARQAYAGGADGYFVKGTSLRHVVESVGAPAQSSGVDGGASTCASSSSRWRRTRSR